jgi:hypothetical protein
LLGTAINKEAFYPRRNGEKAMDSDVGIDAAYIDQPVMHCGRQATFLHMSRGAAIIRYWGDSHAVAVPPEALSLPLMKTAAKPRRPLAARDEPMARERRS